VEKSVEDSVKLLYI